MKQRPWIIVILAIAHILAPLGNFVLNAILAETEIFHYISIFFQPHNLQSQWIHLVGPVVAGFAIYMCKKWSFFVYILAMTALLVASIFGYVQRAEQISWIGVAFVYVLNIGLVGYFLVPAVRQVYFDPRLRWWEALPRYSADFKAFVLEGEKKAEAFVGNFSQSGMFVKSDFVPQDHAEVSIEIQHEKAVYLLKGAVIHHQGQTLVGFGLKFSQDKAVIKNAKDLVSILHAQGRLIKTRLPGPEDSLTAFLRDLFTRGRGLVPEANKTRREN